MRLPGLFDSHCHALSEAAAHHAQSSDAGLCLVTTGEHEWEAATALPGSSTYRFALGVHPWFVHSQRSGWEQRLRQYLLARPDAMVGEAGVDKARLDAPWEAQVQACAAQLDLAAELRRPIVLHCVRAQGFLLELLARRPLLPPVVVHHAYGGSVESAAALLRLPTRSYFGWSGRAARLRKSAAVMASLPADRLLIESDEHEAAPAAEAVSEACAALAAARGWTREETAARTAANARQAFGAGAEPWSAWGTGALEGTS